MENIVFNSHLGDIAVGLYDIPYSPKESVLYLNPLKSNAIIFGGAMSGKTTMVNNILARMNEEQPYISWENTYVLDFGGNIIEYGKLGRVRACFDNSNEENIKRIFRNVEQHLTDNSRMLNGENYLDYQEKHPEKPLPHVTLILENATAFFAEERFMMYQTILSRLVRDGLSKGISVIMTASDLTGALSRLMIHFGRKFALEMPKDKYMEIFGTKVDEPMKIPGRGITIIDSSPREFQAYLPFHREKERDALIQKSASYAVEHLKSLPAELTEKNLSQYCPSQELRFEEVMLGLDYYSHAPIALDFEESHNIAIYGKKKFGKTNLLRLIMRFLCEKYPNSRYVFFDDGREQLVEFRDMCAKLPGARVEYIMQIDSFRSFLSELASHRDSTAHSPVFVILQNKHLFTQTNASRDAFILSSPMATAMENGIYFIFSDVPKIAENVIFKSFNSLINCAFLLDTIGDFVAERGTSSVFFGMDAKEMKLEYAHCDVGDGFYYDVDRDELHKFKLIKTE